MSQMSNVSNPQFYSPEGSTNQEQFKSAQEKRVTPFDERSITPRSVASAHIDTFNQFQGNNADFNDWYKQPTPPQANNQFPQWGQQVPPEQDTPQSKVKQFGFDDFMNYDENQVSRSDGAGPDSQYEMQKNFGEQQSQPNRKQSRDINDIEDLMQVQNSQNVSQQSQPFQKINDAEKFNYINPEQLPSDPIERQMVLKAQELQPPNQNFPFLEGISPMVPSTQQMAFTFHDPNQFSMGIPSDYNSLNKPTFQAQQYVASPHFEDIDQIFNQPAQPKQIDTNQNLNFYKINSYPTEKQHIDIPNTEQIQSQKSLKEQLPDSNNTSQIKNQIASSPQLDHLWNFQQITKQPQQQNFPSSNNPFQQQPQQQPLNYSPIQSLEMIKQFQQLNISSESEKRQQENKSMNNSQINKNDDSELPWETATNNKQTAIDFLQDQWPNLDVNEVLPKVVKIDEKAVIPNQKTPENTQYLPYQFEQPSLQKQPSPRYEVSQQNISEQPSLQRIQSADQIKRKDSSRQAQPVQDANYLDSQYFQPISQPIQNVEFQFPQTSPKSQPEIAPQQSSFTQFQFDAVSQQSNKSEQEAQKQENQQQEQKEQISAGGLFADWTTLKEQERFHSQQSSKRSKAKSEPKEEEFYDVDNFWDQTQQNQFLPNTTIKEEPQQIKVEQNLWSDSDQEPKRTPRNETSQNAGDSQSAKSQPLQTPTQSPQFVSLSNSQNSMNEKKKSNPFTVEDTEIVQDQKWNDIPLFDDQLENKQQFKRELETIAEQDESLTQSMAIQNRNSTLMQDNTLTEQKDNSIEESKVIHPSSVKNQSYEIQSGQKGHSVRESKDSKESNKETVNASQIVDQLLPKLSELISRQSNIDKLQLIDDKVDDLQQRVEGQLQYLVEQMKNKENKEQEEFGKDDYISQKVQMIEKLVEVYGQKLDQITTILQDEKEKQEQKQQQIQSKVSLSMESQKNKPISSPFDLNLDEHVEDSPIENAFHQAIPHSGLKIAQSNIQYNLGPKPFIPFQNQHQTHSRYVNESQISVDKEDNLIKYCTNYQFQKFSLKGLQEFEIQHFRKQCLGEQTTLLDTYELLVTLTSEIYEDGPRGLRIIVTFKNKAAYELSNLIVMYNSNRVKDNYQITPQKISSQYLGPGEITRQEILFPCYDLSCVYINCYIKYTINNYRMGYNYNRLSQTQGAQGMMNSGYSNFYQLSQSRPSDLEVGQFKRNFQFQIARPANKFFEYHFNTSDELNEYQMRCQSEQFYLRSLEELIIFHPWLIQIDQHTLGGKLFLRLQNNEHEFVIKIVSQKNQKCVIQMNEMDMDKKLTEHILIFLTFLFQKLY